MSIKICVIFIIALFVANNNISSQEVSAIKEKQLVEHTFLGTRLVNGESTEVVPATELHLLIIHHFGLIKEETLYNFFGLDQAEIRLGLQYGITDFLTIGYGRNSYQKTYDLFLKYKLITQGNKHFPLTITGFTNAYINTTKNVFPDNKNNFFDRTSYVNQVLISRKFSDFFSAQGTIAWLHERYNPEENKTKNFIGFGLGTRFKILKRLHITGEYYYLNNRRNFTHNPLSIGFEIETLGHLFQLMFSNSQATISKTLFTDTYGDWSEGEIFFGFNLIRVFYTTEK